MQSTKQKPKKTVKTVKTKRNYKQIFLQTVGNAKKQYCEKSYWTGYFHLEHIFYEYFKKKYNVFIINLDINLSNTQDIINHIINNCVNEINDFVNSDDSKLNKNAIFIPFEFLSSLGGHRNLLIYRPNGINQYKQPVIEWFEPHGSCFQLNPTNADTIKISEIINLFNAMLSSKLQKNILLITPNIICPTNGVQAIEESCKTLPRNTGGYCALWSLYFLEKSLKFKNMTLDEISNNLIKMDSESLRKLMLSYSNTLSKILDKYKETSINEIIAVIDSRNCKKPFVATTQTLKLIHKFDKRKNKFTENAKIKKESLIKKIMDYFYPIPKLQLVSKSSSSVFSEVTPGSVYLLEEGKTEGKTEDKISNKLTNRKKTKSSPIMDIEF